VNIADAAIIRAPKKAAICGNLAESIRCLHVKITLAHPIKQFCAIVDLSPRHLQCKSPSKANVA
jgi:hypothetical protein